MRARINVPDGGFERDRGVEFDVALQVRGPTLADFFLPHGILDSGVRGKVQLIIRGIIERKQKFLMLVRRSPPPVRAIINKKPRNRINHCLITLFGAKSGMDC